MNLVYTIILLVLSVIANYKTNACKPEHSHCPTYSVDTKFYCRHEWVRDNCRQMCGLGCFDPDNESSSYFRAGQLGGESCLSNCDGFKNDAVCATNGKTYANICVLYNDACRKKVKFSVRGRGVCICQEEDRRSCKEYENYKDYYCQHPWVKRNCKYLCGYCVPTPRCHGKVDVGFIFEPTEGHTISYQKYFVKSLSSVFRVSQDNSRLALVTLGKKSKFRIKFEDHDKVTSFNEAVDKITQPHGSVSTDIDEALTIASYRMFDPVKGLRSDASKLLIILVRDLHSKNLTNERSLRLAERLRRNGVVVVIIGKGSHKYSSELAQLTGDADNVMLYPTFIELVDPKSIQMIIKRICSKVHSSTEIVTVGSNPYIPV